MRVAIDARALSHPQPGGFKTYTTSLVHALLAAGGTNTYRLYLDRQVDDRRLSDRPEVSRQVISPVGGAAGVVLREQVRVPLDLRAWKPDVVHFPCSTAPLLSTRAMVATIHDAIEFLVDPWLPRPSVGGPRRALMSAYNRFIQRRAATRAQVVITVSAHSKRDLVNVLHIPDAKIRVIPNAYSSQFRPCRDESRLRALRDRYHLPTSPIVTLVSAAPRKNAAGLLRAYAHLPRGVRAKHPLVVVLTHPLLEPVLRADAQRLGLAEHTHFLPWVSDDELAMLYSSAALFAFPSLYEGFGLPVLEAMACGTPVVASNLSAIPEVAGEAVELADPRDELQFAQALARVLTSPERRAALAAASLERARHYSWKRTARLTLDVYEEVAELARCGGVGRAA